MASTLLGIKAEVRTEHERKAKSPMAVTLLGMFTDVRAEHEEKA